jgi:hypothetical protein
LDIAELIAGELQAVLNTLTAPIVQDAFKKWQKDWELYIHEEGNYFLE